MNYATLISIVLSIVLLASVLSLLWYWRKYNLLNRTHVRLAEKYRAITDQYIKLKESIAQNRSFSSRLGEIEEAAAHIQLSHSSYLARAADACLPERYQYISSLSDNGAGAAEIAKLFSISQDEAEQLVTLSKLNRTHRTG